MLTNMRQDWGRRRDLSTESHLSKECGRECVGRRTSWAVVLQGFVVGSTVARLGKPVSLHPLQAVSTPGSVLIAQIGDELKAQRDEGNGPRLHSQELVKPECSVALASAKH